MSTNEAWKGKRFKTATYQRYERDLLLILPKTMEIPDGNLIVYYEFGVSNSCSDYDNYIKQFQDILQKKYGFNDCRITLAVIKKVIVKKQAEYIRFGIFSAEE